MSSQFTFSSRQPAASAAPTVSTSVDSNTADLDHDNDVAPTPSYYNGVTWNKIHGSYGPTADGVGMGRSWVWKHGWKIESLVDNKPFWLCHICHTAAPSVKPFAVTSGTRGAIDHLKEKHKLSAEGKVTQKRSISQAFGADSITPSFQSALDHYYTSFNPTEFRGLLLDWIIQDDAAFSCLESPQLRTLLYYLQPILAKRSYLPTGNTVSSYIKAGYFNSVPIVQDMINRSLSKIHLSFDIWTSRQQIGFFGIHAHFYIPSSGYQNILLALPRQSGHHTGVALAETLYEKLSAYGITSDRIGWFVADNASNNDTCLKTLGGLLGFEPTERRLRCAGHIFNLVAHSILFGTDVANLEPVGDAIYDDKILALELTKWRSQGPIGKLHNVVLWVRRSALQRERLEAKQKDLKFEEVKQLVQDNSTRWNSTYYSLQRAVELRRPLEAMLDEDMSAWQLACRKALDSRNREPTQPPHLVDFLSSHDWSTITDLLFILKPLEEATRLLQGRKDDGQRASMWQVIPFMEKLLTHFENIRKKFNLSTPGDDLQVTLENTQAARGVLPTRERASASSSKRRQARSKTAVTPTPNTMMVPIPTSDSPQDRRLLCTNVNAGWAKLNKYYTLTDLSSAYVAAVVLHPAFTWKWLKNRWNSRPSWIDDAEERVQHLWADYSCLDITGCELSSTAPRQPPLVGGVESQSIFYSINDDDDDDEAAFDNCEDEYSMWCQQPRNSLVTQPLSFWTTEVNRRQYPRLSRMAIDLFTIPAMSDEPERTFSSCSLMITSHRGSLDSEIVEFTQCTKNWLKNGVVAPHMLIDKRDMCLGVDTEDEESI
ncbi:uncharacterized protein CPUR_08851 [Claviceps purpurea 20.1]|uniref:HAT C-terminal dimerisation domain-containing protein n=1 Tax=Claviceps purpurea (strain 20.1) TaxID=1111077 RepID=M1VZG3_CLAP2|nr:uncharacterized protein CPUR_08851 [Claviceps purpurea 20.1]